MARGVYRIACIEPVLNFIERENPDPRVAPATSAGESPFDGELDVSSIVQHRNWHLGVRFTSSVTTFSVVAGDFHRGVILAALRDFRTCPLCSYCLLRVISVVFRLAFPNRCVLLGACFSVIHMYIYLRYLKPIWVGY